MSMAVHIPTREEIAARDARLRKSGALPVLFARPKQPDLHGPHNYRHCPAPFPKMPVILTEKQKQEQLAQRMKTLHRNYEALIEPHRKTFKIIKYEMCLRYGVEVAEFESARRTPSFVACRHKTWWLASKLLPISTPEIAKRSGGRNHTTILHGIKQAELRFKDELVELLEFYRARFEPQEEAAE